MNLSADRLAKLAGLPVAEKRNLNEASNRSMHEDPALAGEDEHRFGKGQLAEEQNHEGHGHYMEEGEHSGSDVEEGHCSEGEHAAMEEDMHAMEEDMHAMEEGEHAAMEEDMHAMEGEHASEGSYMSETVEVNEEMIAREIALMRKERLQENELRKIIRSEIGSIMKSIKEESAAKKTTRRSDKLRKGVTMGMLGPGFR